MRSDSTDTRLLGAKVANMHFAQGWLHDRMGNSVLRPPSAGLLCIKHMFLNVSTSMKVTRCEICWNQRYRTHRRYRTQPEVGLLARLDRLRLQTSSDYSIWELCSNRSIWESKGWIWSNISSAGTAIGQQQWCMAQAKGIEGQRCQRQGQGHAGAVHGGKAPDLYDVW